MAERWVQYRDRPDASKFEESPPEVEVFLDDIEAVCKKHGFSISHEDGHGGFEIEEFDQGNIDWLRSAALVKGESK